MNIVIFLASLSLLFTTNSEISELVKHHCPGPVCSFWLGGFAAACVWKASPLAGQEHADLHSHGRRQSVDSGSV